jgi:putative transposase
VYNWRKMTDQEREAVMAQRLQRHLPHHSPPHFYSDLGATQAYHLSAANFEHQPLIGVTPERLAAFSSALRETLFIGDARLIAWCVLPNHWHALVSTSDLKSLIMEIGKLHGRHSFAWNQEDNARGRQCWFCCSDRRIRSERHYYAVRNYIHHNPVKHGYVQRWDEWPFSSAQDFLERAGRAEALRLWAEFPVLEMGDKWDVD